MKGKNRGIGNTEIRNEGKANVTSEEQKIDS